MRYIFTVFHTFLIFQISESSILNLDGGKTSNAEYISKISKVTKRPGTFVGDDGYLNTMQLAEKYGYRCEEHSVQTSDGYILIMHRITGRIKNPPINTSTSPTVLMMHGVLSASTYFILNGEQSPAGILSDHGFDVWLGNSRGNRYSNQHKFLRKEATGFWDYTHNEMILIDYTTFVDYVLKHVNKPSLHYVGYSQGGIFMSALLAARPQYNEKIITLSYVASTVNLTLIKSTELTAMMNAVEPYSRNPFVTHLAFQMFPYSTLGARLSYQFCNVDSVLFGPCRILNNELFGYDENKINLFRYPIYAAQLDNGISSNQILNYAQNYVQGRISFYDFGEKQNLIEYGTATTPNLNFKLIVPPKLLFYGTRDYVMPKESIMNTVEMVVNVEKVVEVDGYNHLDFLTAADIKNQVYDDVAEFINQNN